MMNLFVNAAVDLVEGQERPLEPCLGGDLLERGHEPVQIILPVADGHDHEHMEGVRHLTWMEPVFSIWETCA